MYVECDEYSGTYYSPVSSSVNDAQYECKDPLLMNGQGANKGEFPHMAAIGWKYYKFSRFHCGGSLISERFVLTAAHCSKDDAGSEPTFVRLGDQNLRLFGDETSEIDVAIDEFIPHEKFNFNSIYYDIALIKLTENVEFNKFIRPACLWQTSNIENSKVLETGWGNPGDYDASEELRKFELDIISNAMCNKLLKSNELNHGIVNSQMCAGILSGGSNSCNESKFANSLKFRFMLMFLYCNRFLRTDSG